MASPEGKTTYIIEGDQATYKARRSLKKLGLQWDGDYWWTFDKKAHRKALKKVNRKRSTMQKGTVTPFDEHAHMVRG